MSPPGQKVSIMLLGKSGGQVLIALERVMWLGQRWNDSCGCVRDETKVWCCKEQYCIGTWNVKSVNQGKLSIVNQEMARVSINILGISELKWTRMGGFNSDDHYIYYYGQESLRRNGIALWVQSQKWQDDLGSFPRQTIQHHSNPSLCPSHWCRRSWSGISSMKSYNSF